MILDAASFATGSAQDLRTLQHAFVRLLGPAIATVAAGRLSEAGMKKCLAEAAEYSGWGRFVLGHNYWMLPGTGDAGSFLSVRVSRDRTTTQHGGFRPTVQQYAKFSSLPVAILAWCKERGVR